MSNVESSSEDDWTRVEHLFTADGHEAVYVFHEDAAITLAWGADYNQGESWTEAWSESGGFPDPNIQGCYLDIRYNGVAIHRDLTLVVDGSRGILPSGQPINDRDNRTVGIKVTDPEMRRARLIDRLHHGRTSQFDRYSKSANIQVA